MTFALLISGACRSLFGITRFVPEPGVGIAPSTARVPQPLPIMTSFHARSSLRRSLSSRRLRVLLSGSVLALLCAPAVAPNPAKAAAEYCQTNDSGNYVCIEKVFGSRSNRGLIYTVNGSVFAMRIDCYAYNYERSSIVAIACWNYDA